MPHLSSEKFDQNAREALADVQLRGALRKATSLFGELRSNAARGVANWEDLRSEARAIKDDVLLHLDSYLEKFVSEAEAQGAKVHWALDADEANQIVCHLALQQQARLVVKSKSMTTEETHLNEALEAEGLKVVETDLGEYIVQLAREVPSHILAPAIHKTKKQIAELFTAKLGIEPTDDIDKLTSTARRILRDHFAAAEVGVSGVNFGIAETGTILILENEGNIRFTTSLPPMHIALMGIEKILPRFADLELFLKLLPRSGTGQRLSAYQSLITGTKREPQDEGPEELHIILLDNGRSKMLAHPVTRQSLACIRCGACLNVCPVYQQIGGHAYGAVYSGPIGSVITPQLSGLAKSAQLPYASSLCGACREVCPVKIDIPQLLLYLRGLVKQDQTRSEHHTVRGSWGERVAFKLWTTVMASPMLYRMFMSLGRALQRIIVKQGKITNLSSRLTRFIRPLDAWTLGRDLRPLEARSFRDRWRKELKGKENE